VEAREHGANRVGLGVENNGRGGGRGVDKVEGKVTEHDERNKEIAERSNSSESGHQRSLGREDEKAKEM
jgi:hypothetical protein